MNNSSAPTMAAVFVIAAILLNVALAVTFKGNIHF